MDGCAGRRTNNPDQPAVGGKVPPLPTALDEVTTALERLSHALSGQSDLRMVVHQVCEQVVRAVPGLDGASVTLLNDGDPFTAATTSDLVAELDVVQYSSDAGPCLDAATTRRLVRATIDEAPPAQPGWAASSPRH